MPATFMAGAYCRARSSFLFSLEQITPSLSALLYYYCDFFFREVGFNLQPGSIPKVLFYYLFSSDFLLLWQHAL